MLYVETPQDLRAHVAALTHKKLNQKQTDVSSEAVRADQRRHALKAQLEDVRNAIEKRSRALRLEHSGRIPADDSELVKLRGEELALREQARSAPEESAQLRELATALETEQRERQDRLSYLADNKCWDRWKGSASTHLQAAREAVAKAIIAECAERTSRIEHVNAALFVQHVLDPVQVQKIAQGIVDAERREAKRDIVSKDRMLG